MSYEEHIAGEIMQKQEPRKSNLKFSGPGSQEQIL